MLSTLRDVEDAKWLTLTEGEEVVWKSNPHIIEYLLPGAAGISITLIWLIVATITFLPLWSTIVAAATGALLIGMAHLRRITTIYVLTTSEMYKRYGVLDEDYKQIRIDKVQNTGVNLSLIERIIGFGDITIYTSGSGTQDMQVSNVPDPRGLNRKIAEMMEEVGKSADDDEQEDGGARDAWLPEDNNLGYY